LVVHCSQLLTMTSLFAEPSARYPIGFDSAPEPVSTGVLIKTLVGIWIMVIFLVFDVAYYTSLAMHKHGQGLVSG
jgi:hypothetical protein